jgi:flavin reductase (DIM6/NTAB) family NADH-FMN oxidoreductase RutF
VVQDIEAGDHQIVVGEVLAAYANRGILEGNGLYRLDQFQTLFHVGRNWFTSTRAECEKLSL